jgi:hypothetical protein
MMQVRVYLAATEKRRDTVEGLNRRISYAFGMRCHRHERALRCRPPAMVESGNLSPTGYVTAGATTASRLLRFQPRPMSPLQQASEPGSAGESPEFASVLMNRCPLAWDGRSCEALPARFGRTPCKCGCRMPPRGLASRSMILPWSRTPAWPPVTGLAERAGLHQLIAELVRPVAGPPGLSCTGLVPWPVDRG